MTSALEKLGLPVNREDTVLRADVGDLILDPLKQGLPSVAVADRVLSGRITLNLDGASTLELTLDNADRAVSRADMFRGKQITTRIAGRPQARYRLPAIDLVYQVWTFRLVGFRKQADTVVLTFEDRAVQLLRRHVRPRKVSRARMTRAEFITTLVRQVQLGDIHVNGRLTGHGIPVVVPELTVRQPIAPPSPQDRKRLHASGHPGFSAKFVPTVKGAPADSTQLHNIETVLNVGEQAGAPHIVLVAAVETIIQESTARTTATNGTHVGLFQQDSTPGSSWRKAGGASRDPAKDATAFFDQAIPVFQAHPDYSPARIAEAVQRSGLNADATYGQWSAEAEATVTEYKGGTTPAVESRTFYRSYQFTQGPPKGPQGENTWDATGRLAQEVRWRRFMRWSDHFGEISFWYVSDDWLSAQSPLMEIAEDDQGVLSIDYDLDESSKFVDRVTVTHIAGAWYASPGTIVVIADQSPADGRWLVASVERELLDPQCTITLVQPQRKLKEPRSELITVTAGATSGNETPLTGPLARTAVGRVYAMAVRVDAKHYQYAWGGGHANFSGPYDCSGFVSACLHAGGLLDTPMATTGLIDWGAPGKGQHLTVWVRETGNPHLSHTFLEFDLPGRGTQWFEAGGTGGLTGRRASIPTAGFTARHYPGV